MSYLQSGFMGARFDGPHRRPQLRRWGLFMESLLQATDFVHLASIAFCRQNPSGNFPDPFYFYVLTYAYK